MRLIFLSLALVALTACDDGSVTQPTSSTGTTLPGSGNQASYSLEGWVFDTAGRPIEGATVEVLSGPRGGSVTTTSADGSYTFGDGFPAAPIMRASKDGYRFVESRFYSPGGTTTIRIEFRLGSPNPPVDLAGTYDLTFTADPACTALPLEARSRSYQSIVSGGTATSHVLRLSGGSFVTPNEIASNVVHMSVFENFVRFHFSDPPIWEELEKPTSMYIWGSAEGELTGPVAQFKFAGGFAFCGVTALDKCEEEIACHSNAHVLTLQRH